MNLLNIFKKAEPPKQTPPSGDIGVAWSNLYQSGDFNRYNPDDLIIKKGNQVYRRMMIDDQVKAALTLKKNAVISREWFFDVPVDDETGEPDPDMQNMADYFTFMLDAINGTWTSKLKALMSAFQNGYAVAEVIYLPVEWDARTYWGVKDIKLRPFDTIQFVSDQHGNLTEIRQGTFGNMIVLPIEKTILFTYQPDVDPHYGESDLRAAYRPYWSKDMVIKFQNIFLERHGSGFLNAHVTEGTLTAEQRTDLQKVINNLSARTGIITPKNVDVSMVMPATTDSYDKAITQHNKSISRAILMPNLLGLSEQGATGSYALGQTQLEAFFWILDEIARDLQECINDQLIKPLAWWNFGTNDYPRFTFEPISDSKKTEIAKAWSELVSKNAVTKTDADEGWLRQLMGAPDKPEDEKEPLDDEDVLPGDELPEDMPDNEDWISAQPEEQQQFILKEFADKPWLKRVNFARIKTALDDHEATAGKAIADVMAQVRLSLEKQIEKIAGERSFGNVKPKEIEGVSIPKGLLAQCRKTIWDSLKTALDEGYETASKELPKRAFKRSQRVGMDKTQADKFMQSKSLKVTGVMEKATLDAVQNVLENALRYDKTLRETINMIGEDTNLVSLLPEVDAAGRAINIPARLENIVRTNTADALNQGRQALFGSPDMQGFVLAFEYSAVLDDRTSGVCEALHGIVRKDFGNLTPPNHYQCRSILVPVTVIDDWSGKEDRIPAAGVPQEGFK